MRIALGLLVAAAAVATAGMASAANVELRDAVARVTVIPEDRGDVKVEIVRSNPKLPVEIRTFAGTTIIDGGLAHRIRDCRHRDNHPSVFVRGVGEVGEGEMPQIVIRTPKAVAVSSNGAVFGAVGRSGSLDLSDSGCSTWTLADVAGEARVRESGAGTIQMGAADHLLIQLSGAANIHAVRLRQGLEAHLSGAGNVRVEDIGGPVDARVSGFGSVHMGGGHVSQLRASVSGMGGVDFGGTADSLDAGISGVGSVRVKQVNGPVSKHVSGLGHVTVG